MTTNVWTEQTYSLYVVAGYWNYGYVEGEPNTWDDLTSTSNTWNTTNQSSNTWTTIG